MGAGRTAHRSEPTRNVSQRHHGKRHLKHRRRTYSPLANHRAAFLDADARVRRRRSRRWRRDRVDRCTRTTCLRRRGRLGCARARPDWQLAYAYDRWRPTFFVNVADDTDPWRDDTIRTVEAQRRRALSGSPRQVVAVVPGRDPLLDGDLDLCVVPGRRGGHWRTAIATTRLAFWVDRRRRAVVRLFHQPRRWLDDAGHDGVDACGLRRRWRCRSRDVRYSRLSSCRAGARRDCRALRRRRVAGRSVRATDVQRIRNRSANADV